MATSYPGGLDSFPTRATGATIDASHINDPTDAVEAVEAELGVNPSGSAATVAVRLDALESTVAGKAAAAHSHAAGDVTSGVLPVARGGTGGGDAAAARTALGLDGTYVQPQGPYSAGATYQPNAVVTYSGAAYRALSTTTGVTPGSDGGTVWEPWSSTAASTSDAYYQSVTFR